MIRSTLILGLILFTQCAFADVYKCKDANGSVVFTDSPCTNAQTTLDHKATKEANTLGRGASTTSKDSKELKKSKDMSDRPSSSAAAQASKSASASSSGDGCDKMRKDFARQQSQSCIEGLQVATGKVMCMPDTQRREYLSRKKEILDAMCS